MTMMGHFLFAFLKSLLILEDYASYKGKKKTREGENRERVALVSFSGTRPCHLTPATEWA